jgi:hypothetical protein
MRLDAVMGTTTGAKCAILKKRLKRIFLSRRIAMQSASPVSATSLIPV